MSTLKTKTINVAKELYHTKTLEIEQKYQQKEYLDKLAYEVASILSLTDKEGNIDPKRVNINLLKDAIMVAKMDKKNSLEEKYSTFTTYINLVEKDKSLKDLITSITDTEQEIKSAKEDYKNIKKETILSEEENEELEKKNHEEKEWFAFTETVVKEKASEFEVEKKEEYIKEKTGEDPMPSQPKVISEIFPKDSIKKELK